MAVKHVHSGALLMAGVMATLIIGNLLASLSPMFIGALMETLHYSEPDAGLVTSVELVAASILISRREDPDRYIAIALVGTALSFAVLMTLTGAAVRHYGTVGFYLVAAGTGMLMLPLFLFMRAPGGQAHAHGDALPRAAGAPGSAIIGAFVVAMIGLTFVGQAAWSFAQRSATNAAVPSTDIGSWLAASTFLTVVGSLPAAWLANRITTIAPLLVAVLATGLTCAVQIGAASTAAFEVPLLVNGIAFGFSTPFIFGTAARLDRSGLLIARLNSAVLFTQAATPVVAGLSIEYASYRTLGFALGIITLLCAASIAPACQAAQRIRNVLPIDPAHSSP